MSATIQSSSALSTIVAPYLNEDSSEVFYYNSTLEEKISKLQALLPDLDPKNSAIAEGWIHRLKVNILTNKRYVERQRVSDTAFSVIFCAQTNNAAGLRYLLRVGEDPNQRDAMGRTAIHIAAARSFFEIVQALMDSPHLDLNAKTRRGKKAIDLAFDQKIEALINERVSREN